MAAAYPDTLAAVTRALVTGGAGLIGSHIVDLLLERGYEVRVYDNLEPTTHPGRRLPAWCDPEATEFYTRDVRDRDGLAAACKGVDIVFHEAAFGGFAPDAATIMAEVNALGTVNVLEAARHAGVQKVVLASSQAVYGMGRYRCTSCGALLGGARSASQLRAAVWAVRCEKCWLPAMPVKLREEAPLDLATVYALSKWYGERNALALGAQWGLPVVALRYALTYGPRQSVSNPYTGVASIFATRMLNGASPVIYEDGEQTRDFTFVKCVARANVLVAELPHLDGEAVNVGTGTGTSVLDFALGLQTALADRDTAERTSLYTGLILPSGLYRPQDARDTVTNAERLRNATGWRPGVPLAEGLRDYVEWFTASGGGAIVDASAQLEQAGIVKGV